MSDKFARQIGRPVIKSFENHSGEKDTYTFKVLSFKYKGEYYELLGDLTKMDLSKFKDGENLTPEEEQAQAKEVLNALNKPTVKNLTFLIEKMMFKSYPNEFKDGKPNEELEDFMSTNFEELMGILLEVNGSGNEHTKKNKQA